MLDTKIIEKELNIGSSEAKDFQLRIEEISMAIWNIADIESENERDTVAPVAKFS